MGGLSGFRYSLQFLREILPFSEAAGLLHRTIQREVGICQYMYKRNMIQCDLKLKRGYSGGLLFFEGGVSGQLTALGILSMIHGDFSFFTSLSECFDHDLFELP